MSTLDTDGLVRLLFSKQFPRIPDDLPENIKDFLRKLQIHLRDIESVFSGLNLSGVVQPPGSISDLSLSCCPFAAGTLQSPFPTDTKKIAFANNIIYYINGEQYTKQAGTEIWSLAGVSTGAGEYKKIMLCLDSVEAASVIQGDPAATQILAKAPTRPDLKAAIAIVYLNPNFTGGSDDAPALADSYHDIVGIWPN